MKKIVLPLAVMSLLAFGGVAVAATTTSAPAMSSHKHMVKTGGDEKSTTAKPKPKKAKKQNKPKTEAKPKTETAPKTDAKKPAETGKPATK